MHGWGVPGSADLVPLSRIAFTTESTTGEINQKLIAALRISVGRNPMLRIRRHTAKRINTRLGRAR